jgi:hypothetical protein
LPGSNDEIARPPRNPSDALSYFLVLKHCQLTT